ncbi:MAG: FAD-dependent monooxygenase [Pseudomonadota bacterium]
MGRTNTDIFISGGGIAGLTAGIALAKAGFHVTLADPAPPPNDQAEEKSDLRSTAYLQPARDLLEDTGLWPLLEDAATPLEALRVINLAGDPPGIDTERTFEAADLAAPAFGWNLPNWLTRKVLTDAAATEPNLDLRIGAGFAKLLTREREALITLTDGTRLRARLALAADGRASPLRNAAGIDVSTTRYGQKAIAFAVTHPLPHGCVSTELYDKGGAFVLVPLPDHGGQPASAVVWMQDGTEALRLHALEDDAFGRAATARSANVLGPLTPVTGRRLWPVVTQTARAMTTERVALLAEAAHVMPPIGAQGLNTSLHDVRAIVEAAKEAPESIGDNTFLKRYAAARARDVATRATLIDAYNRLCRSDAVAAKVARRLGLKMVHDVPQLRRAIMRAGMGT